MRMVVPATAAEGYATVVALSQDGDLDGLNAAKVSLGVLGVVSTVTLQLEPAFKRSVTLEISDTDEDLEDRIFELAEEYEFGDAIWYPSRNQVVYRKDNRVPLSTPGDGVNRFFAFQPRAEAAIELARSLGECSKVSLTV
jgi:L-gulonolactone oxidase